MNFTKQNNPAVIGVLVVILAGALWAVFQQIKHVQEAMAADASAHKPATPAATASPTPTTSTAASTPASPAQSAPRQTVDDFKRPAVSADPFQRPAAPVAAPAPTANVVRMPAFSQRRPSEPLTVQPLPVAVPISTKPASTPSPAAVVPTPPSLDVKSLRVTAVISGTRTVAVVEQDGAEPITVGRGDKIGDYEVARVDEGGIVLSGRNGIVTIPVMSTTDQSVTEASSTPSAAVTDNMSTQVSTPIPTVQAPPDNSASTAPSTGDTEARRTQETGNVAQ